jgi:uncharacterized protein (TIGR00156 family)
LQKLLIMSFATALMATTAVAQFQGPGASEGMTVQQAKSARDDSEVTLVGRITARISEDDYVFQDDTGEIPVEIDDHVWRGQKITPENQVQITGEVDHERNGIKIDVRSLDVVQ